MKKRYLKSWVVGCLTGIMMFNFILLANVKEGVSFLQALPSCMVLLIINVIIIVILYKYSKVFGV